MKIETRIIKKGVEYSTNDGDKLTTDKDFYMITVVKDSKVILKRLFDDPVFAGNAVRALEAFYGNLADDFSDRTDV